MKEFLTTDKSITDSHRKVTIQTLFNNGQINLEGKTSSTEYYPKKFNWLKLRFNPEFWIIHEVYVYTDPNVRFPIFDWEDHIFYSEDEMNQYLLVDKLEQ